MFRRAGRRQRMRASSPYRPRSRRQSVHSQFRHRQPDRMGQDARQRRIHPARIGPRPGAGRSQPSLRVQRSSGRRRRSQRAGNRQDRRRQQSDSAALGGRADAKGERGGARRQDRLHRARAMLAGGCSRLPHLSRHAALFHPVAQGSGDHLGPGFPASPHLSERAAFAQSQAVVVWRIGRALRERRHARHRHHRFRRAPVELRRQLPHAAHQGSARRGALEARSRAASGSRSMPASRIAVRSRRHGSLSSAIGVASKGPSANKSAPKTTWTTSTRTSSRSRRTPPRIFDHHAPNTHLLPSPLEGSRADQGQRSCHRPERATALRSSAHVGGRGVCFSLLGNSL